MNILLINGSPKGKRSNSLRLANSFIDGFKEGYKSKNEAVSIDEMHVASMNVGACKGCFACWQKTPGVCCINDDMQTVIGKILEADIVVWSFPLYYFSVPGILKNVIDRQLPMSLPFMSTKDDGYGSGSHDCRYDMEGKRHVLISTCGFYSAEGNYDSVLRMFDHFLGKGHYTTIFCGQGELFRVKELSKRTDEYLATVKSAGAEYAITGKISEKTEAALHTLLYPRDVFESMADASWGISRTTGEKEADDLVFTRQMAALYNKGHIRALSSVGQSIRLITGRSWVRVPEGPPTQKEGGRSMKGNLSADTTCIMQSANFIISRITAAVCAMNDAQAEASFGRPERALILLYRAAESISGTNKMIFDLALKINQSKINAEDAMLSAQSMDGDGV